MVKRRSKILQLSRMIFFILMLDSNPGPLMLEASALPTVPQLLPAQEYFKKIFENLWQYLQSHLKRHLHLGPICLWETLRHCNIAEKSKGTSLRKHIGTFSNGIVSRSRLIEGDEGSHWPKWWAFVFMKCQNNRDSSWWTKKQIS